MFAPFEPFVVVSLGAAIKIPYPFVHVNSDGSVRELHAGEKEHLETSFDPFDGARPHVKDLYNDKNALGDMRGYCARSAIPKHLPVAAAPADDPGAPNVR